MLLPLLNLNLTHSNITTGFIWLVDNGYYLNSIQELESTTVTLPTRTNISGYTFTLISGSLPDGMSLIGNAIVGTPVGVKTTSVYSFVIRAFNPYTSVLSDRTFYLPITSVTGINWVTDLGFLPIGQNNCEFILDKSLVDFQLVASNIDTTVTDTISYFISENSGTLPPGLSLSPTGLISGRILPADTLPLISGSGFFDSNTFDSAPFDYGIIDSTTTPVELSINYHFIVTASNGFTSSSREFSIFVVGDNSCLTDTTSLTSDNNLVTCDTSKLRPVDILNTPNLGIYRSNNNITEIIDIYDPNPEYGTLSMSISSGTLPEFMSLDPNNKTLFGFVPTRVSSTDTYNFTVQVTKTYYSNTISTEKAFTIQIVGLNNSVVSWPLNPTLDLLRTDQISNLTLTATSSLNLPIQYTLSSGLLPAGLSLLPTGEIVGFVPKYNFNNVLSYTFTVAAQDSLSIPALQQFTLLISPNSISYSNIWMKPLPKVAVRQKFKTFITDANIFTMGSIYRPNDPNFGVRYELKMLLMAGIQTLQISDYTDALFNNSKRKQYSFGTPTHAIAKHQGNTSIEYEVIYIPVYDAAELNNTAVSKEITINNEVYYPASIANMRSNLSNIQLPSVDSFGDSGFSDIAISNGLSILKISIDNSYLPLWMLTPQSATASALGFTKAVTLCYCIPGTGLKILSNISNSGFNFTDLDFTADAAIINIAEAESNIVVDQFIKFSDNPQNI